MDISDLSICRLNIQLTTKCNQRCISCNTWKFENQQELSLESVNKVIIEACELFDIKNIAFTGGEPTIYRNFLEVAKCAKKYCDNVSITTNGYLCESQDKIKRLIEAGVNRFSFSYHGIGKHDEFTGISGNEEKLRRAIEMVIKERNHHKDIYIKIGMLFDGTNVEQIKEMLYYVEEIGVDLYVELWDKSIPIFADSRMANEDKIIYDRNRIEDFCNFLNECIVKKRRINIGVEGIDFIRKYFAQCSLEGECPLGLTDIYIASNGDVKTGCWNLDSIGNIKTDSLYDLYVGKKSCKYQENIKKMLNRECTGCTCGYLMQAKFLHTGEM